MVDPSQREMYDLARAHFGIEWVATGEKKNDNMLRRACMMLRGQWDWARMCYYPLMDWSDAQVWNYLRLRHIPVPADYLRARDVGSGSFATITGKSLYYLRKHFPRDYEYLSSIYPLAGALVRHHELYERDDAGSHKAAKLQDGAREAQRSEGSPVQPATDERDGETAPTQEP